MTEQQPRPARPALFPHGIPRRVLVMGLGVHGGGLGVAQWLMQQGIALTITDSARLMPLLGHSPRLPNSPARRAWRCVTFSVSTAPKILPATIW